MILNSLGETLNVERRLEEKTVVIPCISHHCRRKLIQNLTKRKYLTGYLNAKAN